MIHYFERVESVSRKKHRCDGFHMIDNSYSLKDLEDEGVKQNCNGTINIRQKYTSQASVDWGQFGTFKACSECLETMGKLDLFDRGY